LDKEFAVAKVPKMKAGGPLPTWRPGDPALTVGQVAERLKPIAPDIDNTISKVRHWSREGMIFPVAQAGAGTGKHRLYAESVVYEAAILMATTSAGMNVAGSRFLIDALTIAKFALPKWRKEKGPLYLAAWRRSTGRYTADVVEKHPLLKDLRTHREEELKLADLMPADLMIVIDLRELWSQIEGEP
jgi:DNA-binding transcriptional MerR regulator